MATALKQQLTPMVLESTFAGALFAVGSFIARLVSTEEINAEDERYAWEDYLAHFAAMFIGVFSFNIAKTLGKAVVTRLIPPRDDAALTAAALNKARETIAAEAKVATKKQS
jgi:hypothetical protein